MVLRLRRCQTLFMVVQPALREAQTLVLVVRGLFDMLRMHMHKDVRDLSNMLRMHMHEDGYANAVGSQVWKSTY